MNVKLFFLGVMITLSIFAMERPGRSYPPSVGIFSKAKNCLACHANNDPWQDDGLILWTKPRAGRSGKRTAHF